MIERAVSLVFAVAFSLLLLALVWRHFGGWASRAQLARGATLSLLSIGLALVLGPLLTAVFAPAEASKAAKLLFTAFVTASVAEETARWIALLLLSRAMVTKDPREFLCGGVAVGLGFGVLENVLYLHNAQNALALGALRGVLTAPGHLAYALVSAAGLWSWRHARGSFLDALIALGLAVLLHGFYDAAVMSWEVQTGASDAGPLSGLAFWRLFAAVAVSIVVETAMMMLAIDKFLDWASNCEPHDARHFQHMRLDAGAAFWRAAPAVLSLLSLAVLASPLAVMALKGEVLKVLPVTLGLAASIQLWSVAVAQLEAQA